MKTPTHDRTYALVNPICAIVEKPRTELSRADLVRVIEEKQIEKITFHYTGLDGKFKELRLPVTNRYQTELILGEGERVDGSSLFKGLVDVALSDLYVVPVYRTVFLNPFDKGSLDFIGIRVYARSYNPGSIRLYRRRNCSRGRDKFPLEP